MSLPTARPASMGVPVIFDGLDHRAGYRGDFLDLADGSLVPIPALTDLGHDAAAPLSDGSQELEVPQVLGRHAPGTPPGYPDGVERGLARSITHG